MIKPLTPRGSFEFTPASERDLEESEQTVFLLRELSLADRYRIKDVVEALDTGAGAKLSGIGTTQLLTVRLGLMGVVRNFPQIQMEDERVFGVKRKIPTMEWLAQVPQKNLDEIYEALSSSAATDVEQGKD